MEYFVFDIVLIVKFNESFDVGTGTEYFGVTAVYDYSVHIVIFMKSPQSLTNVFHHNFGQTI